jgi:hypothetical protein
VEVLEDEQDRLPGGVGDGGGQPGEQPGARAEGLGLVLAAVGLRVPAEASGDVGEQRRQRRTVALGVLAEP